MMKKTIFLCAATALLAFGTAGAQSPEFAATVKKLITVSGGDATMKMIPEQMAKMFEQQSANIPPKVADEIRKMFSEESIAKLVDQMIPIYSKYYTQEDLDGLIEFYNSPVGKKLAETQPKIAMESIQIAQQWAQDFGQKIAKIMAESQAGAQQEDEE